MFRKIHLLWLAICMLICLSACEKSETNVTSNAQSPTTSATTAQTSIVSNKAETTAVTSAKTEDIITTAATTISTTTATTVTTTSVTTTQTTISSVVTTTSTAATTTTTPQAQTATTTSYALPESAYFVDIDIVVDDNYNAAAAVMFLQSHGVDTTVQETAPYVSDCTTEEEFAEGIADFLNANGIVLVKKYTIDGMEIENTLIPEVVEGYDISGLADGAYSGNIVHLFYSDGEPIVIYACDESDMSVYVLKKEGLIKYTIDEVMSIYSGKYVTMI